MHIDKLLHLVAKQISADQTKASITISKSWGQGRTVFGGISAAIVYHAIKQKVSEDRVLRVGRNVTQVIAKAIQQQRVCV